jgi:hypothetical protein
VGGGRGDKGCVSDNHEGKLQGQCVNMPQVQASVPPLRSCTPFVFVPAPSYTPPHLGGTQDADAQGWALCLGWPIAPQEVKHTPQLPAVQCARRLLQPGPAAFAAEGRSSRHGAQLAFTPPAWAPAAYEGALASRHSPWGSAERLWPRNCGFTEVIVLHHSRSSLGDLWKVGKGQSDEADLVGRMYRSAIICQT